MSDKLAATFHGGSGTPVFITVVGAGTPTAVTEAAKEALVHLGWTPPLETSGLTPEALDTLMVGSRVYDYEGDEWTKERGGRWTHKTCIEPSAGLVKHCGPINLGEGAWG